jgi:probable rRNA maturation factor
MVNLLINDAYLDKLDSTILENAAMFTLQTRPGKLDSDLSLVIEDDERLRALNNEYLGIDSPTDVLSFPSGEEDVDPETGVFYLGDIIISYPRALEQAEAGGHPVVDELQLLVVHGVLHLLGHDHAEPFEKEEMWTIQAQILKKLGVQLSRLPE